MLAMRQYAAVVSNFLRCAKGTVAVEYGIIATAMFLAIIPAFIYVSTGMMVKFNDIADYLASFV